MSLKQIAYMLFGIIISLSVAFVFFVYSSYTKNQNSEEKINNIISQFEEKFKNDSIYLANANKLLIDKISQRIIDSMSVAYEKKLENALKETNKYKQLLIANNIKIDTKLPSKIKRTNSIKKSKTISTKTNNSNYNQQKTQDKYLNVTTISQIKSKKNISSANVTTYSKVNPKENKLKSNTLNITTYSKLNTSNDAISKDPIVNKNKTTTANNANTTIHPTNSNESLTHHNNFELDHAKNINNLDSVPIYKGCKDSLNEDEQKNCFAINISKHIINKFNSLTLQNSGLKKGIHKVRVLFVVDEHGKTKIGKLVGKWPNQIYKNVKISVETVPLMSPGYYNNKAISVKYSLLIPFIIK